MFNSPKISVIVPVYGVEKYIARCIKSIKQQTFTNFEVLLVNDGTKDNSIAVAESIINGDKRFIVLDKDNGGQGSARNLGLDNAQGEYIAFIDSDDYIEDQYLQLMYNKIQKDNADVCICNVNLVSVDGLFLGVFKSDLNKHIHHNDFLVSMKYISNYMCDKLWRRSLFDGVRFDESMRTSEDALLVFQLIFNKNLTSVDSMLYNYVQRAGSTSKDVHPTFFNDRLKIANENIDFAKKNKLIKGNSAYINYSYLKTFVFFCAVIFARYSKDYMSDVLKLKSEIDESKFKFKDIYYLVKVEKKVGLSLLLFKLSPLAFRYFVRFWFRNHKI